MNQKPVTRRPVLGGAVYILPNLLTSGNLFFGYFSIVKSMLGDFTWAAGAIFLAAIFDVLDGRVARMTNGTSEFGVQYDSLCDLVSFGLAPAIMMFQYSLNSLGRLGWIICFIFLACGALRLARFNVQSAIGQSGGDFTGLPIPMAAGVIAGFMGLMADVDAHDDPGIWLIEQIYHVFAFDAFRQWFLAATALALAFLMVSNVPYRSHKSVKIRGGQAFRLLALLVAGFGLVAYKPPLMGFLFLFLYALSGPVDQLMGWKKPTENEDIFGSDSDNEDGFSSC
ncbi:MAG: CDP-diacylglycerol--serine O-phosphatidyltransferase [Deltaproteobacteria bacterium]|nr:CDP-diacylglycerol--serine O-phosphatidyltransferase [Deltaproteobacteria bacterium]